jgi:hypothetical protein
MKGAFTFCLATLAITAASTQAFQTLARANPLPPPNDLFSNAEVETGYDWYAYGVTKGATHQRREVGNAIWYSWTAPASGPAVVLNWNQQRPFGSFSVYTGTNPAALKLVKPVGQNRLGFLFMATMGTRYHLSAQREPAPDYFVDFTMELLLTTVALTQPTGNFKSSDAIPLSIVTTELPSMVESVKYYGQTFPLGYGSPMLIAESDSPPYSAVWTNSSPGHWFIYAELTRTDSNVLDTANSEIRIRPYNDDFADRKVLTGSNINVNDSVAEATVEPGEPDVNLHTSTGDIWYTWTAPDAGYVFIPNIYANIFTGSTLATLSGPITTTDNAYNDVPFAVSAGETLQIAIFDTGSFSLTYYGIPANDNFASATVLSGTNTALIGNNRAATTEPGEPVPAGTGGHTVWFTWMAPMNGTLIVEGNYTDGGSSGPLVATVYTGEDLTNLVAMSTNGLGTAYIPVLGGTTYHIALDNTSTNWEVGNLGDFALQLSLYPAQPNDDFANRIELTGNAAYFDYSSLGASIEPGEPNDGFSSLWWTWTAPYDGTAMVSGVQYSPVQGNTYTGDSLTNLVLVASKDVYFYWGAQAGKTYQIAITSPWLGQILAGLHLHYYTNGTPIEP